MKNQELLNHYFSTAWPARRTDKYKYSGLTIAYEIAEDEWVLDVGCGNNLFRGKIKNLVGIDPANDNADVKVSIEDFVSDQKFDVAFCLGSLNFGSEDDIINGIAAVVRNLKPVARIYWRCNPGLHDHGNEEFESITVFPWTQEHHFKLAPMFGFRVKLVTWDNGNRIYSEWVRE